MLLGPSDAQLRSRRGEGNSPADGKWYDAALRDREGRTMGDGGRWKAAIRGRRGRRKAIDALLAVLVAAGAALVLRLEIRKSDPYGAAARFVVARARDARGRQAVRVALPAPAPRPTGTLLLVVTAAGDGRRHFCFDLWIEEPRARRPEP